MNLLLLQPPIQDFYDTDIRLQPIGLCYLKGAVEKFVPGVRVRVHDFHQGRGRHTISVPAALDYLRDYYPFADRSPFCTFHQYYHFGAPFETIADEVAAEKPDVVGISSLFSPYYREVLKTAEAIKARTDVPIIVGGSHVSAAPETILESPHVDFVIRGEGEKPLVEFLRSWRRGRNLEAVPNLGYKKDGAMRFNELAENFPIEEIPLPALDDLPLDRYRFGKRPLSFVITSRSCPHRCSFCSVHLTFGRQYRRRSPDSVLEEIRSRYRQGYRVFDFEDDNLTFYRDDMKAICERLGDEFADGEIQLLAMNGISYLSLDSELLLLMKRAGFTHLNLALVSSDTTVRETTKRPHTVEKYVEVVGEAAALGFSVVSYQILGLPGESLASMAQTLTFAARLPVLLGASMFYLTPNSPIARGFPQATEEDVFTARLTAMAIETGDTKREDIYTLFISTRIVNFLKSASLRGAAASIDEVLDQLRRRGGRSTLGVELLERLFAERVLHAATPQGFRPLPRFKADLFFRLWRRLESIGTLDGGTIRNQAAALTPARTSS